MNFANIKKSMVYDVKKKYDEFIASGGSPDMFKIARKIHKEAQRLQEDCPGGGSPGARHQGPRQVNEVVGAGDERF